MIKPTAFLAALPAKAAAVHAWMRALIDDQDDVAESMRAHLRAFFAAADGYPKDDIDMFFLDPVTGRDDDLRAVDYHALATAIPWSQRLASLPNICTTLGMSQVDSPRTSIRTLLYAFEVAARRERVDFRLHIQIFPDVLWAPLLAIAYAHGHAPMFALIAPFIQDSWYSACVSYTEAVKSGRVAPDFDVMAAMPMWPMTPDASAYPFTSLPRALSRLIGFNRISVRIVSKMLLAAYSWVDPEPCHLQMFPRHHAFIKGVARSRFLAKAIIAKRIGRDCAERVMRCYVPTWRDHAPDPQPWDSVIWLTPAGSRYDRNVDPMFKMVAMAARHRMLRP